MFEGGRRGARRRGGCRSPSDQPCSAPAQQRHRAREARHPLARPVDPDGPERLRRPEGSCRRGRCSRFASRIASRQARGRVLRRAGTSRFRQAAPSAPSGAGHAVEVAASIVSGLRSALACCTSPSMSWPSGATGTVVRAVGVDLGGDLRRRRPCAAGSGCAPALRSVHDLTSPVRMRARRSSCAAASL